MCRDSKYQVRYGPSIEQGLVQDSKVHDLDQGH